MISFYIEKTPRVKDNPDHFVLWMEKDGKKYLIDGVWDCLSEESDEIFQKEMAQLYSTDGAYYGSEDDIVEFADRIRNNDYHFEACSELRIVYSASSDNHYVFFGRVVETGEFFEFYIYNLWSSEISRAKIGLLLQERKKSE
jgi:hypothetical protein